MLEFSYLTNQWYIDLLFAFRLQRINNIVHGLWLWSFCGFLREIITELKFLSMRESCLAFSNKFDSYAIQIAVEDQLELLLLQIAIMNNFILWSDKRLTQLQAS